MWFTASSVLTLKCCESFGPCFAVVGGGVTDSCFAGDDIWQTRLGLTAWESEARRKRSADPVAWTPQAKFKRTQAGGYRLKGLEGNKEEVFVGNYL